MNEITNAQKQLIKKYKIFLWIVALSLLILFIPLFQQFYSPGFYKLILWLVLIGLVVTYIARNNRLLSYVKRKSELYKLSFRKLYLGYFVIYIIIFGVLLFLL
ncbi:hypothetical protein [Bacillus sp. B1-b2]|uniref:hypothetical protein n=1 Tax=Bacillus sp. B1-b2 TaxID=2653201 RepID=UPI0012614089|nr:hypothetical protein [Bacillus sp. B1-b2]KAB7668024.1 hypothetical protein F9279_13905 [Bacillus sp. B1-b2]